MDASGDLKPLYQEKSFSYSMTSFKPKSGGLPTQKYREVQRKYELSSKN